MERLFKMEPYLVAILLELSNGEALMSPASGKVKLLLGLFGEVCILQKFSCADNTDQVIPGPTKGLGGYSEYTIADEKICFPVPAGVSLASAATVPLASCTSLLALFSENSLNIPRETSAKETVLIWGGSCKLYRQT